VDATKSVTCRVIRRSDAAHVAKQGTTYVGGISAQSAGSQHVCLHLLTIPPGGQARPHLHEAHETAIYLISGEVLTLYGDGLTESVVTGPGDFLYIPPGVPHIPANLSQTEPCVALAARSDANDQESVVLLPELEERARLVIQRAREKWSAPTTKAATA
jgi:uncharacterized RmlC-like cupin family protein